MHIGNLSHCLQMTLAGIYMARTQHFVYRSPLSHPYPSVSPPYPLPRRFFLAEKKRVTATSMGKSSRENGDLFTLTQVFKCAGASLLR